MRACLWVGVLRVGVLMVSGERSTLGSAQGSLNLSVMNSVILASWGKFGRVDAMNGAVVGAGGFIRLLPWIRIKVSSKRGRTTPRVDKASTPVASLRGRSGVCFVRDVC